MTSEAVKEKEGKYLRELEFEEMFILDNGANNSDDIVEAASLIA